VVSRASRHARMVIETSPPTDAPAVPTAGVLHPTRDIHARVRRCNVHVKRQKSRVERLPIRPLRTPALKRRRRRTSSCTFPSGAPAHDGAAAADGPAAFTIPVPLGRVAQWESARFTRERSQVRNPPRPLESPDSGVPFVGVPVPNGAQSRPSTRALRHALSSSAKRMACASTRRVNFGSVCPSWSMTCRGSRPSAMRIEANVCLSLCGVTPRGSGCWPRRVARRRSSAGLSTRLLVLALSRRPPRAVGNSRSSRPPA
jgi:hypothetical protein